MIEVPVALAERRDITATVKLALAWFVAIRDRSSVPSFPRADELERAIGVSRATAYRTIDELLERGLVRRRGDSFEVAAVGGEGATIATRFCGLREGS